MKIVALFFLMSALFICDLPLLQADSDVLHLNQKGRTEISDVPWTPGAGVNAEKVIYGPDDRLDVYEESDPTRKAWAAATCALISTDTLTSNSDGTYTLAPRAYMIGGFPPCEDEPFASQPMAAFCSGFMVADDIIATAGHCIEEWEFPEMRFVFGFDMLDAATPVLQFQADQVYTGVEMIAWDYYVGLEDYALIRVDRKITVAEALPIREKGEIAVGELVGVIGHPAGLPKKIAFGATTRVTKNNESETFFSANLDAFPGNSGSPVFNARTGIVEGILVTQSGSSFVLDGDCFRSGRQSDDSQFVAEATKTTLFAKELSRADKCCGGCGCSGNVKQDIRHFLGDFLLIGLSLVMVIMLTTLKTNNK